MTDSVLREDRRTDSHPPLHLSPRSGLIWNLAFPAQCLPIDQQTRAPLPEAASHQAESLPAAHARRRGRPDRRGPARTLRPGASWLLFTVAAEPHRPGEHSPGCQAAQRIRRRHSFICKASCLKYISCPAGGRGECGNAGAAPGSGRRPAGEALPALHPKHPSPTPLCLFCSLSLLLLKKQARVWWVLRKA